ncbi:MAG: isoprenyl transferase [Proteobacteria bacterium]|nr:isoprenyl transferase [Pseudomonadota bacterium]
MQGVPSKRDDAAGKDGARRPGAGEGTPRHVAIIMDGNGRWATKRSLPRVAGHRAGMEAVRRVVRAADARGISFLTLFSFSTENWARPAEEVSELMGLLKFFIRSDLAALHRQNVRIRVIGAREGLAREIVALLDEAEGLTRANTGLTLVIAFNYGARAEIAAAARHLAAEVAAGRLAPEAITEGLLGEALPSADIPDPDLLIRTSGEQRISNFLLWQSAYAEFYFTPVLWPEFDDAALDEALSAFAGRKRRFGGL